MCSLSSISFLSYSSLGLDNRENFSLLSSPKTRLQQFLPGHTIFLSTTMRRVKRVDQDIG